MRTYTIQKASGNVPLCSEVANTPWAQADALEIDNYPWYASGDKQPTHARLLYDDEALYAQFLCQDKHIFAQVTEINGMVCEDSCVEMFVMPEPERQQRYFNLEINCCGNFLLGWGAGREEICTAFIDPGISTKHVTIATSVPGPTKAESPDDDGWWAAARIPYALVDEISGERIARPTNGTAWQMNCYRCGGKTDDQYACWNPIEWPHPDFHRPEQFGQLQFA